MLFDCFNKKKDKSGEKRVIKHNENNYNNEKNIMNVDQNNETKITISNPNQESTSLNYYSHQQQFQKQEDKNDNLQHLEKKYSVEITPNLDNKIYDQEEQQIIQSQENKKQAQIENAQTSFYNESNIVANYHLQDLIHNHNLGSQISHSMQTQYIQCFQCNLEICRNFITLPCLHQFCFQCLKKVITQQIQKKTLFLLCLCGKRLKTQILDQIFLNQQSEIIKENLFANQLKEIESNLTYKWKCQQCDFFCIRKEQKQDRIYCPICLEYYKY